MHKCASYAAFCTLGPRQSDRTSLDFWNLRRLQAAEYNDQAALANSEWSLLAVIVLSWRTPRWAVQFVSALASVGVSSPSLVLPTSPSI